MSSSDPSAPSDVSFRRFHTLTDVAEILATSQAQVYALVRTGELPAIKVGGRGQWRIEASALEDWIDQQYTIPGSSWPRTRSDEREPTDVVAVRLWREVPREHRFVRRRLWRSRRAARRLPCLAARRAEYRATRTPREGTSATRQRPGRAADGGGRGRGGRTGRPAQPDRGRHRGSRLPDREHPRRLRVRHLEHRRVRPERGQHRYDPPPRACDRVRELGDASVPFTYDIHALSFSDHALSLETELHKEFTDRRVNCVNPRREFFFATPEEVREFLAEKVGGLLEFSSTPEAVEYLQSRGSWPNFD